MHLRINIRVKFARGSAQAKAEITPTFPTAFLSSAPPSPHRCGETRVMSDRPMNVLFLCTHNSARSIIAEAVMNKLAGGKMQAYSAGSQPSGRVNPHALTLLKALGYDVSN